MAILQGRTVTGAGLRFASLLAIAVGSSIAACGPGAPGSDGHLGIAAARLSPDASTFPSTFARQWMTNIAFGVQHEGVSPPVAARSYAYGAIAAYEAVVRGVPGAVSLVGQLNGLTSLPAPDPSKTYDWPTVLAATE